MELREITENEYLDFIAAHQPVSFLQSPQIAKRRTHDGWQHVTLGFFEGQTLVGATQLYSRVLAGGFRKFEVLQGPLVDFSHESIAATFLQQLKQWAKRNGGVELKVTPNVLRVHRDNSGTLIDDSYSSDSVKTIFETNGFSLMPYSVSDHRADVFRWTFVKDMSGLDSEGALQNTFSSSTKRSIKRAQKSGITIRELPIAEIETFHDLIAVTGERWHFTARPIDYYNELLESFGPEKIKVFVAEISRENYKAYVDDLLQKQLKIIKETSDAAVKEKAVVDKEHYEEILTNLPEANPIVLAGTVVIYFGGEVTHLFSGSYKEYSFLRATSLLRYHALKFALEAKVPRFNFYGTKGNHSGHPEEEGIFQFKRGFGGNVEEQLGVFVYTPRPAMNVLHKIAGKLKRALT